MLTSKKGNPYNPRIFKYQTLHKYNYFRDFICCDLDDLSQIFEENINYNNWRLSGYCNITEYNGDEE